MASLVQSLQLDKNQVTLVLTNHLDAGEYEDPESLQASAQPPSGSSVRVQNRLSTQHVSQVGLAGDQ